jgi:hypothetical protein
MVGLSLVAVFAIAAIAASGASALPEWGKCTKIGAKGGKYTDSNCTTKAKKKPCGLIPGRIRMDERQRTRPGAVHWRKRR